MRWPTVVKQITFPEHSRIIAVSDIHGNLPFFQGLMEKVALTPDDQLILLGDLLEKGPESLALLRHVMDLQKTHSVHTVCGNCDGLVLRFFEGDEWDGGFFINYLREHPECTIRQMAAHINFGEWNNFPALRQALREAFRPEWDFLRSLPHVLESPELVFVHGGLPSLEGMEKLDAWQCMKNDYFYDQGLSFPKYVVVGHCPTTLFHPHIPSAAPIVDRERKIVSIDGGCVLKLDGQLNAVMLPHPRSDDFTWKSYDGQRVVTALEHQSPSPQSVNIRWGHNRVEVLERGEEFSLCRHLETGTTLHILTSYLRQQGADTLCEDCTNYNHAVSPGDKLSLCHQVEGGILAKKHGVTGWYWGKWEVENG